MNAALNVAHDRIAAERSDPTGSLDLSDLTLDYIPEAVGSLTHLQSLFINRTGISDLSPISDLANLEILDCANTPIPSLTAVADLPRLVKLECSNTPISSLAPVGGLTGLRTLYCWNTDIEGLGGIANLTALEDLDCSGTFVIDLAPLAGKHRLRRLNVSRNKIRSLSVLGVMPRLLTLFANKTHIRGIDEHAFPRLFELEISETGFVDLEAISHIFTLELLDCAETRISDISPLSRLTHLRTLNCSGCRLPSIPPAVWDHSRFQLFAWKTEVPDVPVSVLSKHSHEDCTSRLRHWLTGHKGTVQDLGHQPETQRLSAPGEPVQVFISYSHKNKSALDQLHTHFAVLRREGKISAWIDREVLPGEEFDWLINRQLSRSSIFIALLSPDYLNSNYCYDIEFKRALELKSKGQLRVVPVIVDFCDWEETPFGQLKAVPEDGKPISAWENTNQAYLDVVKSIRKLL